PRSSGRCSSESASILFACSRSRCKARQAESEDSVGAACQVRAPPRNSDEEPIHQISKLDCRQVGPSVRFETNAHPATKLLDFGNTSRECSDSSFAFLACIYPRRRFAQSADHYSLVAAQRAAPVPHFPFCLSLTDPPSLFP